MTPDELHAFIKGRGLSHREAAEILGLTRNALRKNLYGVNPVSAQTERIIELLDQRKTPDGRDFSF